MSPFLSSVAQSSSPFQLLPPVFLYLPLGGRSCRSDLNREHLFQGDAEQGDDGTDGSRGCSSTRYEVVVAVAGDLLAVRLVSDGRGHRGKVAADMSREVSTMFGGAYLRAYHHGPM